MAKDAKTPSATPAKKSEPALLSLIKSARRVSVPLVAINTPDSAATIKEVCAAVNGESPKVSWDIIRGMMPLNEQAKGFVSELGDDDQTKFNPVAALTAALKLPQGGVLFILLANRWIVEPAVIQAAWNLRDAFKANKRMLVLLAKHCDLPPELSDDVMVFDEPLPEREQLAAIVHTQHANAGLECADGATDKATEALRGLSAFSAEQITAMSLRKEGLDVDALWERKRQTIEQTPGLKVYRGGDTFDQVGGLQQIKQYLTDLMAGNGRPNAVTWLDEIDKAMPGGSNDTSGVSQDQLGTILTYMEDNGVLGVLLVGAPGTGKSAIAKSAGSTAGVLTVRFDLGACKGSLVGQSEQQIRQALKIIDNVSNQKALFIATANSVANLDSALKRRFPFIFYFDLPTREEKDRIWAVWTKRFNLIVDDETEAMSDEGWSGANIQKCCESAWRLDRPIWKCRQFIVPCARASAKELESLRRQADGTFLSASSDGAFCLESLQPESTGHRQLSLAD